MNERDIGIILGPGTILGIGEIGKYNYRKNGLKVDIFHTYSRKMKFFDIGSIRIRDLPDEFQQGGMNSLHLPSTLRKIVLNDEKYDELIIILKEVKTIVSLDSFVDFSENSIQFYIFKNHHKLNLDIVKLEREYPTKVGFADFLCFDKIGIITL